MFTYYKQFSTATGIYFCNASYLTLPYHPLQPSAENSSGPNAHPRINPKVTETFYDNKIHCYFKTDFLSMSQ